MTGISLKVFIPATTWAPEVFTVGSVIPAVPSKATPLMVRAEASFVAVAAFPVIEPAIGDEKVFTPASV